MLDKCDISIIVSADSDLVPAIELIREFNPLHKVFVYFPPNRFSFDLNSKADGIIKLENHLAKFQDAILPNSITLANGYEVKKPSSWK